jgi:predicted signal transduction protein with EAL and GGDEF domain
MSLIRQIWLLLITSLLLSFAGSILVNVNTLRAQFEAQLRVKNHDNAQALALVLTQQKGNVELMSILASAQFDTGYYESVKLLGVDGRVLFDRRDERIKIDAPQWFVRGVPIQSLPGSAKVSDGWRAVGEVQLVSHSAFAYEALWRSSVEAALSLALVMMVALVAAAGVVHRVRKPLSSAVEQAQALVDGRFLSMPEPNLPELRSLTQAMNHMVARLKSVFKAQSEQVDELRRQVNCDSLTGLSERRYFLAQLDASLIKEDGPALSTLVLLRIPDLTGLNQRLGRVRTDQMLLMVAQALEQYGKRVAACLIGRLNGCDFALYLPVTGMAQESSMALSAALRMVLPGFDPAARAVIGAVPVSRSHTLSQIMSLADSTLSRAEAQGGFAVEVLEADSAESGSPLGEAERRVRLEYALAANKLQLAEYPVVSESGDILHLECPARLQLEDDGPYLVASYWVPWAIRADLMARFDERMLRLALASTALDGNPRCIQLSWAALSESGLISRWRDIVQSAGPAAQSLWLEVPENLAIDRPALLRDLAKALRPLGVRVGLEHSGGQVSRITSLFEIGLDFIKLDAATTRGLATDEHKQHFVQSTITLLRGMTDAVIAEGVLDDADARALWHAGASAISGPWARSKGLGEPAD